MAACSYVQIKDLTLYSQSFFIAGLIIAKTERKILSSQWNGTKSGVITYTVRDTKEHFINCTIWGTEQYIENSNRANKIGDIVAIYRPVVVQNNSGSGYYPRTSSPFELTVKEGKAFIHRATDHFDYLLELQNQTIKSTILTLKLSDLNTNPDIGFLNADLLVFVSSVEPVRHVQTKSGLKVMRRVHLMDQTMDSVAMTVWHAEYQERMDHWVPLETILHLVDVRAEHSNFDHSTVLSMTAKTIIIENPTRSSRSNELMAYIHSLSLEKLESLKSLPSITSIDITSIKDVMSVQRILDQIEFADTSNCIKEIKAIVYGVITKFDINSAVIQICGLCKRSLPKNSNKCEMESCKTIETIDQPYMDKIYMPISISDHTGTLISRIVDDTAPHTIGHTSQSLKTLAESHVDSIFKRFILNRFAFKVIVKPKLAHEYFASILSIEDINSDDIAMALKP